MIQLVKKYRRIAILQPLHKNIDAPSYKSMVIFINNLFWAGFTPTFCCVDKGYICEARNTLAKEIVDRYDSYDICLWVDSDQTFTYNDFIKLLKTYDDNSLSILSGAYLKRSQTERRVCAYIKSDIGDFYNPLLEESTGLLKIDGCGFGFILMSKDVLKALYDKHGYNIFDMFFIGDPKTQIKYKGEDFIFCEKAKEAGYDIYLDCNVRIGHYGYIHTPNDDNNNKEFVSKKIEQ